MSLWRKVKEACSLCDLLLYVVYLPLNVLCSGIERTVVIQCYFLFFNRVVFLQASSIDIVAAFFFFFELSVKCR